MYNSLIHTNIYNYSSLVWAHNGPYFRLGCKLFMSEVFSSKRLESYEYIRVKKRSALVSRLCPLSGKPISVREHLSRLTLSVISRIVLGKMYLSESESESETSAATFKDTSFLMKSRCINFIYLKLENSIRGKGGAFPVIRSLPVKLPNQNIRVIQTKTNVASSYLFKEIFFLFYYVN